MQRHFGQIWTTTLLHLPKTRSSRKRCFFSLDRFEPPHRFETASNSKYEIALFFPRTDPNYRKPNNDLLKTKKKPRQQTVANSIRFQLPDKLEFDDQNNPLLYLNCAYRIRTKPIKTPIPITNPLVAMCPNA